jgi:DNA repair photolyase
VFVRWDNLTIAAEREAEQARLPGYRDPAVVRRFDAPEAMDIRFYEVQARSVLNRVPEKSRMPFRWTVNPYRGCSHACVYCFARPTHTYLDFNAGRDFEREIVVKVNAPEVLCAELGRPSWKHEHVAMGTNTDPYQWVEGRYRLMPGIWEALRDAANPCSILTKSPLLLRDLPLMLQIAEVADISASLSVPTLDEKAWRATEPHTPHPRARLEAVAELNRAGIPTGVLVAPLIPGVNDAPEQLEPLLQMAHDAGAVGIGGVALHLRGEVRALWFEWLREHRPDLIERYEKLYARGAYAPVEERRRLAALVTTRTGGGAPARMRRLRTPGDRREREAASAPPARRPVQESLF